VYSHTLVVHFYIDFTSLLCRLIELCKIAFLLGENGGVTKTGLGDVTNRGATRLRLSNWRDTEAIRIYIPVTLEPGNPASLITASATKQHL
jgi:hypothetical protein